MRSEIEKNIFLLFPSSWLHNCFNAADSMPITLRPILRPNAQKLPRFNIFCFSFFFYSHNSCCPDLRRVPWRIVLHQAQADRRRRRVAQVQDYDGFDDEADVVHDGWHHREGHHRLSHPQGQGKKWERKNRILYECKRKWILCATRMSLTPLFHFSLGNVFSLLTRVCSSSSFKIETARNDDVENALELPLDRAMRERDSFAKITSFSTRNPALKRQTHNSQS